MRVLDTATVWVILIEVQYDMQGTRKSEIVQKNGLIRKMHKCLKTIDIGNFFVTYWTIGHGSV